MDPTSFSCPTVGASLNLMTMSLESMCPPRPESLSEPELDTTAQVLKTPAAPVLPLNSVSGQKYWLRWCAAKKASPCPKVSTSTWSLASHTNSSGDICSLGVSLRLPTKLTLYAFFTSPSLTPLPVSKTALRNWLMICVW